MIKVVVNRKRWFRGDRKKSRLLLKNGKMCCIGFLARALRYTPKNIRDMFTLDEVRNCPVTLRYFAGDNEHILAKAYDTNDSGSITDSIREKRLKRIGKEMGVWFVFKN